MATHRGLRHLALRVTNLARSRAFYEHFLAMKVVWEPDPDNVYFSSGCDNLALHQIGSAELAHYQPLGGQLLDHVGVMAVEMFELPALPAGAWMAFQVPGNFDAPSHRAVRAVAKSPEFAADLADLVEVVGGNAAQKQPPARRRHGHQAVVGNGLEGIGAGDGPDRRRHRHHRV